MNVTFRFCFRSPPLKSLKLPVFKGLSTDLGSHSFLHISFYPRNIQHSTFKKMKANTWKTILQIAISILTAIATTLGVTSCMG